MGLSSFGRNYMKVGDLVQVKPACVGFYIVASKSAKDGCWMLVGAGGSNFPMGGKMNEEYIEVVSESR
jgi:hypothetical protein